MRGVRELRHDHGLLVSGYADLLFMYAVPCVHCGEPVIYSRDDAVYIHRWGRWPGDNGYYCTQEDRTSALGGS